ncbi:hypothetical protein AVEN_224091-1 [Araneus ventricosus]|uniref:Uncharacterized protein n=1 Tax=Araneus ventricosus TaxID=182803 RepID=A0A4Y2TN38_ARAVE|nr:hypothetical protein AVEN_224091-1 [Araneus ventricosus]
MCSSVIRSSPRTSSEPAWSNLQTKTNSKDFHSQLTRGLTCLTRLVEITSQSIEPVPDERSLPIWQFEDSLVPYKCSVNFGKKKKALGHREAIRRKLPCILNDGVIVPHENTQTASKGSILVPPVGLGSAR